MANGRIYLRFIPVIAATLLLAACNDHHEGTVTAKQYVPSSVGTGLTSSGKLVITDSDPKWVIELDNGADDVQVTKEEYTHLRVGMHVVIDEELFDDDIRVLPNRSTP
jgi:hypothetical protein